MSIHAFRQDNIRRAGQQSMEVTTLPAPTGGMDSRQTLSKSSPETCVYAVNLNPSEYGMQIRQGYQEWADGVDNGGNLGIRTVIPFTGDATDGTQDRLFAVNNEGIWDVTTKGAPAVLKEAFINTTIDAGFGNYTHYTTDAELDIIMYADSLNGLFSYDPVADTWSPATDVSGVDPTLVTYITVHKQRIWMAERGSTVGWYLPIGSRSGIAVPFYFGAKFRHGGSLVGLFSWSVDGGAGVDDYLVAISRGGDVMPYQGTDPESDWQNVGTYFIGQVPRGTKVATDYGGDLAILSEFGVTAMSDLLQGADPTDPSDRNVTYKIGRFLRDDMKDLIAARGWEIRYLASEGMLMVSVPPRLDGTRVQYVYLRTTRGWCFWRDVPIDCVDTWQSYTHFGTGDKVYRMDVTRDDVKEGSTGTDIQFSILFNYSQLGADGRYKRVELIRPTFISQVEPSFSVKAAYDYDVREAEFTNLFTQPQGDAWDAGLWDVALWSAGGFESHFDVRGAHGIGRGVSVGLGGRGVSDTILVNVDIMWRAGGVF